MLLQGMAEIHLQPLIALALVSLLHGCADTYVSAELAAHGQAAGQHARHLSNVLMRLRASVNADTFQDLCVDLLASLFISAACIVNSEYWSMGCALLAEHGFVEELTRQ